MPGGWSVCSRGSRWAVMSPFKARRLRAAEKRAHHAHFGIPMNFSDEEKSRFGDHLNAPGK
jgi:hypothetical protein